GVDWGRRGRNERGVRGAGCRWPGQKELGTEGGRGEGADRGEGLIVEDRAPMRPAVICLEYAARGRAGVINVRLPRHASDGADPVAHRADVTIPKLVKD